MAWLGYHTLLAEWLPKGTRGEVCFARRTIYVNPAPYSGEDARKNRNPHRITETLAHELGHIRLHREQMLAGIYTDEQEEEAQLYARIFLIPRRAYQAAAPSVAGTSTVCAYRAAREYGVTPGTAIVRAREVGVLPKVEIPADEVTLSRLLNGKG